MCSIGSSSPKTVTEWILPPAQSWAVSAFQARPRDILRDDDGFTRVANLVSMRQDLYKLFLENAFGVDVEDDFKIRIFHPSAKAAGLPARLDISEPDEHAKYFLNAHFYWCLNVHFHGGSTEDDEELGREPVRWFMDRLSFANDAGVPLELKLRKEDWETELGKAILEFKRIRNPEFEMTWPVDGEDLQDAA